MNYDVVVVVVALILCIRIVDIIYGLKKMVKSSSHRKGGASSAIVNGYGKDDPGGVVLSSNDPDCERYDKRKKKSFRFSERPISGLFCPYDTCTHRSEFRDVLTLSDHINNRHEREFLRNPERKPDIYVRWVEGGVDKYIPSPYNGAYGVVGDVRRRTTDQELYIYKPFWEDETSQMMFYREKNSLSSINLVNPLKFFDEDFGDGAFLELQQNVKVNSYTDRSIVQNVIFPVVAYPPLREYHIYCGVKSSSEKDLYVGSTVSVSDGRLTDHRTRNAKLQVILSANDCVGIVFAYFPRTAVEAAKYESVKVHIESVTICTFNGRNGFRVEDERYDANILKN